MLSDNEIKVAKALKKHQPATPYDLSKHIDVPRPTIRRICSKLYKETDMLVDEDGKYQLKNWIVEVEYGEGGPYLIMFVENSLYMMSISEHDKEIDEILADIPSYLESSEQDMQEVFDDVRDELPNNVASFIEGLALNGH